MILVKLFLLHHWYEVSHDGDVVGIWLGELIGILRIPVIEIVLVESIFAVEDTQDEPEDLKSYKINDCEFAEDILWFFWLVKVLG